MFITSANKVCGYRARKHFQERITAEKESSASASTSASQRAPSAGVADPRSAGRGAARHV